MPNGVLTLVPHKDQVRRRIWKTLTENGVERFPGAWGRIPNFKGVEAAAERLRSLDVWQRARVIECNPDAPQLPVRWASLADGKRLYMAVPRLRQEECFLELEPGALGERVSAAASIQGASTYGRAVGPEQLPHVDLVVCGSVAVSEDGSRIGKGGGYSDLEFAILSELGRISDETAIVTTVHPLQLWPEPLPMKAHDIPVDYIVMPNVVLACPAVYSRPAGVVWDLLPRERIKAIPALRERWEPAVSRF